MSASAPFQGPAVLGSDALQPRKETLERGLFPQSVVGHAGLEGFRLQPILERLPECGSA